MQHLNNNKTNFSWYFTTILLSVFIALGSFIILFILGGLIFGYSISGLVAMQMNLSDTQNLPFLKYMQALQSICMFIVPCIVIAFVRVKKNKEYFYLKGNISAFNGTLLKYIQLDKLPPWTLTLLGVLIILLAEPIINFSGELNSHISLPNAFSGIEKWMFDMENKNMEITKLLLSGGKYYHLLINIFVIAVLPAVSEELVFRSLLQNFFIKITGRPHVGIFITAFIFSALHIQFISFLPRLLLGLYLGYIFYWSKNLWVSIIAHFTNNAAIVMLLFFVKDINLENNLETIGTSENLSWTIGISVIAVSYFMWAFYKNSMLKKLSNS